MMPELIDHLARQQNPVVIKSIETVSKISYSGDIGGIMCHIQPEDAESVVVVSLTPVRVRRKLPFAAAVLDYQKHRVKKLKKQGGTWIELAGCALRDHHRGLHSQHATIGVIITCRDV
jgi:hypothetical protein